MSDHAAEIDALMQEALQVWQVPGALGADGDVATMEFLGHQFKKVKPKS